jgi:hypothetical protein
MKYYLKFSLPLITFILFIFCGNIATTKETSKLKNTTSSTSKHPKFNSYWYQGTAEITSYKLTQARYGEMHEGIAVNIFVTEDFLPEKQVKADYKNDKNTPILKLNSTKKFITGMYPYSLMTSTFSPINKNNQAIKVSFSAQEWCGNTFAQLNNRENFKIDFHSYFESNADRKITLKKNILENELWNLLRISPDSLPVGNLEIIPSFEFLAIQHKEIKAYRAKATLKTVVKHKVYTIQYLELERTLAIKIRNKFPFIIESWEETIINRGKTLTTRAEKIKTIQAAYWSKNGVSDIEERKKLGL